MSELDTETEAPAQTVNAARPPWLRTITLLASGAFAIVLAVVFFNAISTVLLGVLAAAIIAATLNPALACIPLPRALGAVLLGLGLIAAAGGLLLALSWPLARPISDWASQWPQKRDAVNHALETISSSLQLEEKLTVEGLLGGVGSFLAGEGGQRLFSRSADVLLGLLISLALVLFGSIFLLAEPAEVLIGPAVRLFPQQRQAALRRVLSDLACRYRRWVVGTLSGMTIVFTLSLIGYVAAGIELALPLALLAGVAEIVPTVGPATASVIATLFVAATQSGPKALAVLVVYGIIQAIEAYVILPLIMRGAVSIHPAVTLFTVVLWGKIFGLPGLILAIPINVTIWTFLEHFHQRDDGLVRGEG